MRVLCGDSYTLFKLDASSYSLKSQLYCVVLSVVKSGDDGLFTE